MKGESRVGFYGGTFDPIHNGHINLAIEVLEKTPLDRILFCPAFISPDKQDALPHASGKERFEIVQLAVKAIPEFSVTDLELEREGPSYTIDTIRYLIDLHPGIEFYLVLGKDALENIEKWKEIEALLQLAPPIIGTPVNRKIEELPDSLRELMEWEVPVTVMEICSTDLRERLLKKKYCGHLMPSKVLDYIEAKSLY
ncbi:MAG: Nicotinate-nucleotide adenylyltransferase [Chlamydiae bacterium]|nr:Nicotinate-nucleotide adenylyltransferase [Chlamydiota bacterium]